MQNAAPKFLLIATLLFLLFNYPLLSAANKTRLIAGIPVLYLYIGAVWIVGIVLLYLSVRQLTNRKDA